MVDALSQFPSNPLIDRFLSGLPREMADSFSPDQLQAVQRGFCMRYAQSHAVDIRRSFGLPGGRFYVVLLAGRERRSDAPPPRPGLPYGAIVAAISTVLLLLL